MMTEKKAGVSMWIRICAVMFLQFMMVAAWFMQLGPYLKTIGVENGDTMFTWFMSVMALGCLAGPLIGMVADRFFAAERVLATLNIAAAALFILTACISGPLSDKSVAAKLSVDQTALTSAQEALTPLKTALATAEESKLAPAIATAQTALDAAAKNVAAIESKVNAEITTKIDAEVKAYAEAPDAGFIQKNLPMVVFVLLLLQMCCYMPTWGLATVVAMGHLSSEQFARVRIFGSIGWVASGLCSFAAIKFFKVEVFDGSILPLYAAAGIGILGALFALTIPKTAPAAKGQPMSIVDALGLRTLSLFKDYNFAIFIVLSILGTVAFATHFNFTQMFLQAKGFKYITVTQNWGQAFEILIMGILPLMLAWLGFRKAMIVGFAVQALRYGAFYLAADGGSDVALYAGIIAHGIIYSFIYVGGQIYIDKKAPESLRGQAQGFYFLATFGVGMILGNIANTELMSFCKNDAGVIQWAPFYKYVAIYSAVLVPLMWILFRDKLKGGEQASLEEKEAVVEEEIAEHPVV